METKIVSFAQIHISQSLRQGVLLEKKRRNLTGVHSVSSIGHGLLSQWDVTRGGAGMNGQGNSTLHAIHEHLSNRRYIVSSIKSRCGSG